MPKALIVNPFWDTLGGGERYTASFAGLLLESGWQVDIIWPKNLSSQIKNHFAIEVLTANWINVKYTPLSSLPYSLVFWVSDGSLPVSLSKITIIHLQFPFTGVGGRGLSNLLKSRFYKFVVNSQFTKSVIDREFSVKSTVIYPPIDVGSFKSGKKIDQILYVGRFSNLTQKKGQSVLIEAFSEMYKDLPGWQLVLAGGTSVGTEASALTDLKHQSENLPVRIITDPDFSTVKKLYAESKIFWSASGFGVNPEIHPTGVEHFGISLVEAMAAGCVPIVVNAGGHKEIVVNSISGYLWNNIPELEKYTLHIIKDELIWKKLSDAAVKRSKIFSTEQFNTGFSRLLKL